MFEISMTANGVLAACLEDAGVRAARIKAIARTCARQVLGEFAARTGRESLDFRFSDQAFTALRLASRSKGYQKQQVNRLGRVRPFYSPTDKEGHMATLVRVVGPGHRVSAVNNTPSTEVRTRLFVNGARILNFHPQYAREFLNISGSGPGADPQSGQWIQRRFGEVFPAALFAELQSAKAKKLKGGSDGR